MERLSWGNKNPMKKDVHATSIHGDAFMGVDSLWPHFLTFFTNLMGYRCDSRSSLFGHHRHRTKNE
jgi:hypothetical protein